MNAPTTPKEMIAHLQRENAALRAWKESALAVEREWDAQVTAKILGARLGESCRRAIAREVPKLVVENAALRADKERLDWLESLHSLWEGTEKTGPVFLTRAAIDAARKEARP